MLQGQNAGLAERKIDCRPDRFRNMHAIILDGHWTDTNSEISFVLSLLCPTGLQESAHFIGSNSSMRDSWTPSDCSSLFRTQERAVIICNLLKPLTWAHLH